MCHVLVYAVPRSIATRSSIVGFDPLVNQQTEDSTTSLMFLGLDLPSVGRDSRGKSAKEVLVLTKRFTSSLGRIIS